ncbi:xanthine dehydrogenase family protein molybdopterin-binding subunit [Rhizobium sp. KVB221]|uniref:Xanthine dehydrogenase family protein molybdopterin-binding subunit n=1 Tax=Rhizobium setariae TaxID=2801340 RepID=A0A936YRN7_9HYPH|nr:xanthine dehydrogenase family protein molybdopterin-binding subunit [Rhizobium setariae]MBL0371100.1 xanthine dehydrogenase family protein molybdopterin-binding subunit [Rhizobium setariae]
MVAVPKFGIGASALRKEDFTLIRGQGSFTDDIRSDEALHGFVLRSQYAHAAFRILSTEAALAMPGVRLILTAADIAELGNVPCKQLVTQPDGSLQDKREAPLLCRDRVRHMGDAVAFIVAESREKAEDAAELIEIDWQDLDAHVDLATALEADAALVWEERDDNLAYTYHKGNRKKADAAFERAAHVTDLTVVNNRIISNYLEPRAAVGRYDTESETYILNAPSQGVHSVRNILAKDILHVAPAKVTVITGDVGGGFGTKAFCYREYALVLEAARRLEAPVRWVSSRTEHALADTHGRDSIMAASLAFDAGNRITAMRVRMTANMGAYLSQYGPMIPTMTALMATGVYDIPVLDFEIKAVYTNTTPVDAYRGAGRPEAAYLIERIIDAAARELGLGPAELRRINFIRPDQFPYRTQGGCHYDVGEFEGHLDKALSLSDWQGFEQRRKGAKNNGRLRGIGLSTYVEICAFGGSEPAHLHLNQDGTITLYIGTQTNGQGHATAYSQFIAEKIGIDFDKIIVRQGDTRELAKGGGTGGSRSIPIGGVSVLRAGEDLAEKIKRIAGDELEASPEDIELVNGVARVAGTDRELDFAGVAKAAKKPDDLIAIADVHQDEATYPNGTHVVEVEIDPETGQTEIVAYQIVDDFGVTVNPILLAGQIHGGIAQGAGQALIEGAVYSENGQLLTATLMDYAMPRADSFPMFKFETRNVPSKTNALGIKGAGEAATIGSTPAVMNAVIDALYHGYGIPALDMPATPGKIWAAIEQAKARNAA